MKVKAIGFPKSLFPFRSVSQRLNLEYDEIDEIMDQLFRDIFENALSPEEAAVVATATSDSKKTEAA